MEREIIRDTCFLPDGRIAYEGEGYKQGDEFIPHGRGKQYEYSDEAGEQAVFVYDGQFKDGLWNGMGTFSRDGRVIYAGEMQDNQFHGRGVFYWETTGEKNYEGDFAHSCAQGQGKAYNEQGGLVYEGGFSDGVYDGLGRLYDGQGKLLYAGVFRDNQPVQG